MFVAHPVLLDSEASEARRESTARREALEAWEFQEQQLILEQLDPLDPPE